MESNQDTQISRLLCRSLADRCNDPNIVWPYHPRVGIGQLLIDCLIQSTIAHSRPFHDAITSGRLELKRNQKIGGKKRSKRLDLVISDTSSKGRLVALEAKACMTAHAKAQTRLVAELTSSLDALLDSDPLAKLFALVVVNCGDRFTSPLNLPGPNIHNNTDGQDFCDALIRSVSNNPDIAGILLVPIRFDNEKICEPILEDTFRRPINETNFTRLLVQALSL
jgi:hypothetical protein